MVWGTIHGDEEMDLEGHGRSCLGEMYVAAIPEGETRTYGDVSLAVYGHKKGAQAVGAALRFWDAESAADPSFYPQLDDAWDRVVSKQTGSTLYPG